MIKIMKKFLYTVEILIYQPVAKSDDKLNVKTLIWQKKMTHWVPKVLKPKILPFIYMDSC